MKKALSIILTIVFVFVLSSCWLMEKTIVGSGEKVTYEYNVDEASELSIEHISLEDRGNEIYSHLYIFDAEKAGEHRILIEGQQEIIDSIHVRCKDKKLSITGNFYEKYETDLLAIKIYGFTFESISLENVRGSMVSKMAGKNITFNLTGLAYLSCPQFETEKLNVTLKDASQLVLGSVKATEALIKLTNSTSISATRLESKKCNISLENSSQVTSYFVSDTLTLELSGTSSGTVEGTANTAKIELSGTSKLNGLNLKGIYVDANIMGASTLSISAQLEIKAYINGDSSLTYKGNCKEKIDASGEAMVNHVE